MEARISSGRPTAELTEEHGPVLIVVDATEREAAGTDVHAKYHAMAEELQLAA